MFLFGGTRLDWSTPPDDKRTPGAQTQRWDEELNLRAAFGTFFQNHSATKRRLAGVTQSQCHIATSSLHDRAIKFTPRVMASCRGDAVTS